MTEISNWVFEVKRRGRWERKEHLKNVENIYNFRTNTWRKVSATWVIRSTKGKK